MTCFYRTSIGRAEQKADQPLPPTLQNWRKKVLDFQPPMGWSVVMIERIRGVNFGGWFSQIDAIEEKHQKKGATTDRTVFMEKRVNQRK